MAKLTSLTSHLGLLVAKMQGSQWKHSMNNKNNNDDDDNDDDDDADDDDDDDDNDIQNVTSMF